MLGYATTGRFRNKAAYDTTVEASIACDPKATKQGVGTLLYQVLFRLIGGEDIHRIVAGIAQPNEASNALHEKFGFKRAGTFTGGAGNSTNIGTCCGWRGRSFCDLISCASDDKDDSKPQKTFG